MSTGAANSLLKFLEEPEGQILAILETTSLSRILPTIQSRCQTLHFQPLVKKTLIDRLIKQGIGEKTAILLAELTNSFEKAVEISQDEWFNEAREIILQWFNYLKVMIYKHLSTFRRKWSKYLRKKNNKRLALTCSWFITVNYWKKVLRHSKPKK